MLENYYRLLVGNINVDRLYSYQQTHLKESAESDNSLLTGETYQVTYRMNRGNLTEEQWDRLIKILETDTFKKIIDGFFVFFTIPAQYIEFIQYRYGISPILFDEFFKQKDGEIKINFCSHLTSFKSSLFVKLCEITMPELSYELLDPCLTALIEGYYDALKNFIISCDLQEGKDYFHLIGTCSPWIEEMFDLAFIDVNGSEKGQTCMCSSVIRIDDKSMHSKVLKAFQSDPLENASVEATMAIDPTIHLADSYRNDIRFGARNHLYAWRNRVGVLTDMPNIINAGRMICIDSCYGYSFDTELFEKGESLYGYSDASIFAPDWAIVGQKFEFLRVPYNLVPVVRVSDAEELIQKLIEATIQGCVFRGQTSEYYLNRSQELMDKLYGDQYAKEPSISSYALREKDPFEHHYAQWATIIRHYIFEALGDEDAASFLETLDATNYYLLCLAVAQHYGLPTYGLDISYSFVTALFFSFFVYKSSNDRFRNKYIRKESGDSIIYIFKPKSPEAFDFDRFNEKKQLFMRPIAQTASFAHSSWGMATNAIAERMIMGIKFDSKDIDFNELNSMLSTKGYPVLDIKTFFPTDDPFIHFLRNEVLIDENLVNRNVSQSVIEFDKYLKKHIYQIDPEL